MREGNVGAAGRRSSETTVAVEFNDVDALERALADAARSRSSSPSRR